MSKCDACSCSIKSNELKTCKLCRLDYHYQCIGIASENFLKESKQAKTTWKCPKCKNKEKKVDNSSPVLRSQQPIQQPLGSPIQSSSSDVEELKAYFDLKFQEASIKISKNIQAKITSESKATNGRIDSLTVGVEFMTSQFEELKKHCETQTKEILSLKEENCNLKLNMKDMNSRFAQVEQQARECNLEIQCVPENKTENLIATVKKISQIVSFDLGDNDVMTVHRVAKLQSDSPRPRSIIARLATPRIRDNFLASVKIFNKGNAQDKLNTSHLKIVGEKQPIYVAEHLSPANKQLHAATRTAAAAKGYQFVWVRNGRVFVRKDIKSKSILIKDIDFIHSL